ncbi:MAG: threonine synthase [Rhodospirillaceae bacterium]|nr:threonine synthase [Rhodospirillaceae bacterium]
MNYISTRGAAPRLGFEDVLLTGLARDGGLYVPDAWPSLPADAPAALAGLSYADLTARVLEPFAGPTLGPAVLGDLTRKAYAPFHHAAVAPLGQIDRNLWLLELFHGPTLAFKDYALQLLGGLFDHVLAKRGERLTIVGATSGDTGSAAIEAVRGRDNIDIFMLHPHGRVSDVQRRQMTTVDAANVFNIAIDGTFDDCQDIVKALFGDLGFRDRVHLSAVNSINFARIAGQIAYYVAAATALGGGTGRPVTFAVPTGNFGNVFAAHVARAMGLPVGRLIIGSNANDILHRFFKSGAMETRAVVPTLSPSMDIQISSNFERLLFDLLDRDGAALTQVMADFRAAGTFAVSPAQHDRATTLFASHRLDDAGTLAEIARVHGDTGRLIDPHTAVAVAAARALGDPAAGPVVALASAHPAKFPDAVKQATGVHPDLPPWLADLHERPEHATPLPADAGAVRTFILAHAALTRSAA